MNLAEALVRALPELPTKVVSKRKPRFNPSAIVREENDENGDPVAVIYIPERGWTLRSPKIQYELLCLFDGERSYAEILEQFHERTGAEITEEQLKQFVTESAETGLWYESAQERNLTL